MLKFQSLTLAMHWVMANADGDCSYRVGDVTYTTRYMTMLSPMHVPNFGARVYAEN